MRLVSSYALPVLEKMALVIRAGAPEDPRIPLGEQGFNIYQRPFVDFC
jgi:hypothetical protein